MTFWHPLVNPTATGATAESNFSNIERIRELPDGPERTEAINAMVVDNIPLVMLKVESYTGLHHRYTHLRDDMVSEGVAALTEAVQKLADLETPSDGGNPNGFIGQRILWAIARLAENDSKQQIPEGYSPPYPLVVDPMEVVDTLDLLNAACQTPEDVTIIEMRHRGCTDQEIADRLEIPRCSVQVQRNEILQRYTKLANEVK